MANLIENKEMSSEDFMGEYNAKLEERAGVVNVQRGSSTSVVVRKGKIERRTYKSDDPKKGNYVKFAVPVKHEDKNKFIELFFDECGQMMVKAQESDGRVTVAKNDDGKLSFA